MAARRTLVEDLILLACRLPWQAGVGLALGTGLILHLMAVAPTAPLHASRLTALGPVYSHTLLSVMAYLFQFLIPPALLLGAGISAWRRSQASRWVDDFSQRPAALATLTGAQFEQLAAQVFRQQGFSATEQLVGGPDGGVDVVLTRGTERFVVQCKHWRTQAVGASVVRELKGVVAAQGASGGYVVTSGTFTARARAFGAQAQIRLIDGATLRSMAASQQQLAPMRESDVLSGATSAISSIAPPCPNCGGPMQRRTAGRGPHIGNDFWGCTGFPKCRGIVAI